MNKMSQALAGMLAASTISVAPVAFAEEAAKSEIVAGSHCHGCDGCHGCGGCHGCHGCGGH